MVAFLFRMSQIFRVSFRILEFRCENAAGGWPARPGPARPEYRTGELAAALAAT
jgi:hypothetical protein